MESLAAKYGHDIFPAVRRVGPQAFELVEAAGVNGSRAARVMARHGEAGATCILKRPRAMAQFLQLGEESAAVLVRHPGVGERVLEAGGASAVKALGAVNPRNGRRIAMLMEEELAQSPGKLQLLDVIAKYGDRGADFVWKNKGALATAAGLTAFLANPEAFISGATQLSKVAGETTVGVTKVAGKHVLAPAVNGLFSAVNVALGVVAVLIVAAAALMWKWGVPRLETVKEAIRKK
jgi:hypothetical protein